MATHSGILAWRIAWRSLSRVHSWGHKELDMTKQLPRTLISISFSHLDGKNITFLKGLKKEITQDSFREETEMCQQPWISKWKAFKGFVRISTCLTSSQLPWKVAKLQDA